MPSVFFDLETSDKDPIGQIINFSFICVDSRFEIVSEFSGDVRLSRLHLPSPGAILANRVNVLRLQAETSRTERQFCKELYDFFTELIEDSGEPVTLIGYNSFRFDIPYLRTVMIRNGISPYFKGKLIYRDLYAAARKLSVANPEFPRSPARSAVDEDKNRLSLSLETLSSALGLLHGKQIHHSRADVLLTIDLAKVFLANFGLDIRKHEGYEGTPFHRTVRSGEVLSLHTPHYDLLNSSVLSDSDPITLLDIDNRGSALWINLREFKSNGSSFKTILYSKPASSFVISPRPPSEDEKILAKKALNDFKAVKLSNFFTRSECDIEMDIYRIDFQGIDALHDAIWRGDKDGLKRIDNRDCSSLYTRNLLANFPSDQTKDPAFQERFTEYCKYRYGGKMLLSRSTEIKDDGRPPRYHPTLSELYADIESRLLDAASEDRELLLALKSLYDNSESALSLKGGLEK